MTNVNTTKKNFTIIFIAIVFIELLCGNIESLSQFHYITKPSIVTVLIIFFLRQRSHLNTYTKIVTLLALVFSLFGDVLLMFVDKSPRFFIGGLIAFLIAHIMYILVFLKKRNTKIKPVIFIVLLFTYASGLFYLLKDGLSSMLIPVLAYVFVILTMATTAYLRKESVSKISYNLVFIGALFFLLSDSILATNKFYKPLEFSGISIMLTYAIAQYLIVLGILKQKKQ
jgi:uncharacterized membrane protein YhhN